MNNRLLAIDDWQAWQWIMSPFNLIGPRPEILYPSRHNFRYGNTVNVLQATQTLIATLTNLALRFHYLDD